MIITRGYGENSMIIARGFGEIIVEIIKSWVDPEYWESTKRKRRLYGQVNRITGGLKSYIH